MALDYFPLWEPAKVIRSLSADDQLAQLSFPVWDGPLRHESRRLAVLCSHDCDVENPRERTGLILAPIVKVPARPGSSEWDGILASGSASDEEWDFIMYFPLEFPDDFADQDHGVVDFSAVTSMARAHKVLELLLDRRVGRVPVESAGDFRTKLAAFLGRDYQEPRPDDH